MTETVITAENLTRYYDIPRGMFSKPVPLKALDGASVSVMFFILP